MYKTFNAKFPLMKPLHDEIYGKLIFFAGCESNKLKDELVFAGCLNVLVTYVHLRNKSKDNARKTLAPFRNVILDSGGFTFIQRMRAGETISDQEVKDYNREYIEFCDEMKDTFNWVFEFDMNAQISEQYRRDSIDEMNHRGIRVVPVIHEITDLKKLDQMGYFDHDLVALAGKLTGNSLSGPIIPFFNECRKRGVMVHGLAATDEQSITTAPYATVDSSSWLAGSRYGCTYIFQNGRLKVYDKTKKAERKRFRSYIEECGINYENILNDIAFDVNCLNATAWRKWQEFLQYDTRNSYWLSESEKAEGKKLRGQQFNIKKKIDPVETLEEVARDVTRDSAKLLKISDAQDNFQYIDQRIVSSMYCDNCYLSHRCDKFKEGSSCYYKTFYMVESTKDVVPLAGSLITMQMDRIAQGRLAEKYDGGRLDPALSKELQMFFKMGQQFAEIVQVAVSNPATTGGGESVLKAIFEEVGSEDMNSSEGVYEQEANEERGGGPDPSQIWEGDLFS